MSIWQILGIDETHDTRSIKKAYARQLKQIDQEQNPDAFIQLRQALEDALNYAEYHIDTEQENTVQFSSNHDGQDNRRMTQHENQNSSLAEKLQTIQHDGLHIEVIHTTNDNLEYHVDTTAHLQQNTPNHEVINETISPKEHTFLTPNMVEILQHSVFIFDGKNEEQHYHVYYHHPESLIFQLINQSLYYLDTEQFHDESFLYFKESIYFIQQQQLIEQIELKNYFSIYLSSVQSAKIQPDFSRFVLHWHTQFPDHEQLFLDTTNEQLYDYIEYFQQQSTFIHRLDKKIIPHLNKLIYNHSFSLSSMLRLYFKSDIIKNLHLLSITEIEHNKNYFFIYQLNEWHRELWLFIIILLSSWLYLRDLDQEFHVIMSLLNPKNIVLITIGIFIIYYIVQFILKAKILTQDSEKSVKIQNYLKYSWFFTGILFSLSFSYLNQFHSLISILMSYIWLIFTCFIFSIAQYKQKTPLYKELFKSVNLYIDYLVILASLLIVLLYAFIPYDYYDIKTPQWLYVYSFIPIGFLFFGEYFYSLYRQLGYSKQYYLLERYYIKDNIKFLLQDQSFIIARAGLIFSFSYMIHSATMIVNFYTSVLLFLSILIIAYRHYISYSLKYLTFISYFVFVFITSNFTTSSFISLVIAILFIRTLYYDWKKI